MTHICVSQLITIVSDNGLSPDRRQAIIWNNDGLLLFGPMGRKLSEIFIEIYTFSFKKMHLKMSPKWRPFCLGLNVWYLTSLKQWSEHGVVDSISHFLCAYALVGKGHWALEIWVAVFPATSQHSYRHLLEHRWWKFCSQNISFMIKYKFSKIYFCIIITFLVRFVTA